MQIPIFPKCCHVKVTSVVVNSQNKWVLFEPNIKQFNLCNESIFLPQFKINKYINTMVTVPLFHVIAIFFLLLQIFSQFSLLH